MEKYGTAGQPTDDNMAHAHGMLDTLLYRHTLRIGNTYCFSTASVVGRNAPQCYVIVHYLSCSVGGVVITVLAILILLFI